MIKLAAHRMLKLSTLPELAAHARSCWRKIRYDNRHEADVHCHALISRGIAGDVARLRAYPCHHCNGWHVGHRCVTKP